MGWLADSIMGLATLLPERKTAVGAAIQVGESGIPQFSHLPGVGNYRRYALEGYSYNDLVYAAIEERATSAAEPRLACYQRQAKGDPEKLTAHPLLELFEQPNPFMDHYTFIACIPMFLDVAGNCFLWKDRSAAGKTAALWHLRPDRVFVIPDDTRHLRGYQYRLGAQEYFLPAQDVLHIRNRAVLDDWYGLPTMAAAAPWVDVSNAVTTFTQAFFRNGAVMSGLLNIQKQVTESERQLIQTRFRENSTGRNAFNLLVLDSVEASFTAMGLPLGERGVAMPSLDEMVEAHVLRPFGVPFELVQARLGQRGQRSAVREARAGFWDETMRPLMCQIAAQLQMGFRDEPILGDGWDYLEFDTSTVQALQEDADALMKRAVGGYQGGVLMRGEARRLVGHDATKDDDVYFLARSSGLVRPDEVLVPGAAAALPENVAPDPNADPTAPPPNPLKPPADTVPDGHTGVSGHVRRLPALMRELQAAVDGANGTQNGAQH